jgi:tetratricopeptide (TPR) repeat protein
LKFQLNNPSFYITFAAFKNQILFSKEKETNMKKAITLIVSILYFTGLIAQKTTVGGLTYTTIIFPKQQIFNSDNIITTFYSPMEENAKKIVLDLRKSFDPTNTTPVEFDKLYMDVINIKYDKIISKDKFVVSFTTTDFIIEDSLRFDPRDESLDLSMPIYTYSYKSTLSVADKDGVILFEEDISNLQSSVFTIKEFYINTLSSERVPQKNQTDEEFLKSIDRILNRFLSNEKGKALLRDLEEVKRVLIDNFSYNNDARYFMSIYGAKGKYDYDSINLCQEKAKTVIKNIDAYNEEKRTSYEQIHNVLTECIRIWEKEAATANFEDKKARINKDIYIALQFNIAHSYIILGDIDKAKEAYEKANKLIERTFMVGTASLQEQLLKIAEVLKLYSSFESGRVKVIEKK